MTVFTYLMLFGRYHFKQTKNKQTNSAAIFFLWVYKGSSFKVLNDFFIEMSAKIMDYNSTFPGNIHIAQ